MLVPITYIKRSFKIPIQLDLDFNPPKLRREPVRIVIKDGRFTVHWWTPAIGDILCSPKMCTDRMWETCGGWRGRVGEKDIHCINANPWCG